MSPADPDHPGSVLDGLEALDVRIAGPPFREVVRPAYERLSASDGSVEGP